jgi:RHS repeat-associated protein
LQVGLYKSKGKWKYLNTTYGYDIANELTSILITNPTATIDSLSYSYDPNGNRTNMTKSATVPMATSMSGTVYDEANEMVANRGNMLTYDNNGNITFDGTNTYTWDARNRLTNISRPGLSASFDYDALGRRISKTVNDVTTDYVYDGWDIIQDTTDGVTTDYTRTLNIDEPLALERSDGTVRYYLQDALGSVVVLTDGQGLVTTTYQYDAFGNTTINGSDYNPFQYTGRENDGTGLYYYRARYYSPQIRRFVSEDPIGLSGGINFYSYTSNNPLNFFDPSGKDYYNSPYHTLRPGTGTQQYNCMAYGVGSPNWQPNNELDPANKDPNLIPPRFNCRKVDCNSDCKNNCANKSEHKIAIYEELMDRKNWHVYRNDNGHWSCKYGAAAIGDVTDPDKDYQDVYHPQSRIIKTCWCCPN